MKVRIIPEEVLIIVLQGKNALNLINSTEKLGANNQSKEHIEAYYSKVENIMRK